MITRFSAPTEHFVLQGSVPGAAEVALLFSLVPDAIQPGHTVTAALLEHRTSAGALHFVLDA